MHDLLNEVDVKQGLLVNISAEAITERLTASGPMPPLRRYCQVSFMAIPLIAS
jgi:hypothetical protein